MNIIQRGNPGILKKIQEEAKKVSVANGINKETPKQPVIEGGAYNSIRKQFSSNFTNSVSVKDDVIYPKYNPAPVSTFNSKVSYNFDKDYFGRLEDSIHTVGATKEYYNAVQALFSLYSVDKLSDNTLGSLNLEDLNEIRGIVRDFLNLLNSY